MRIGPYELVRHIGSGGMGEVWAAHAVATGPAQIVAIKRLPEKLSREVTYRQILLDEARLSMLLSHPNIVDVFDAGEDDGEAYIVMEFVHGLDLSRLRKLLEQNGQRLPTVVIAHIIGEVLRGLDHAHNLVHDGELLSLIHRDISPHNVMLATNGQVKITDFGVARLATEDTSGTHVKGKARYMPPEQLRGESRSPQVDLFAVGAVMQELLDGAVFRSEAMDDARLLGMAVDGYVPPPLRPFELPREIAQLRAGLLEPNPRARFQTAQEALSVLTSWAGYRDAAVSIADLVQDQLEAQLEANNRGSQTDLAKRSTDLQSNNSLGLSNSGGQPGSGQPADDFGVLDPGAGLEGLLLSPEDPMPGQYREHSSSPPRREREGSGPPTGAGRLPSAKHKALESGSHGALELDLDHGAGGHIPARTSTGPSAALELDDTDTVNTASPRRPTGPSPGLAVDPSSFNGSAPRTGSTMAVRPRRPWGKYIAITLALAGLGAAAYQWAPALLEHAKERVGPTPDTGPAGFRHARVAGLEHAAFFGFRLSHMDKLTTEEDIFYDFLAEPKTEAKDTLTAFSNGEAEFALTTLDRFLVAKAEAAASGKANAVLASAKIIAVVDLSLGAHALVLDSVEFPRLRTLAALTTYSANQDPPAQLAIARYGSGESLFGQLDALLTGVEGTTLDTTTSFRDPAAVYEALIAVPEPPAPLDEDSSGDESESESESGEVEPPPPPPPPVVAAMLPEPWISKARAAGMSVAVTSREFPYALVNVLIVTEQTLESEPDLVEKVLASYYEGLRALQASDTGAADAIAAQLGLTVEEAATTLDSLCVLDVLGSQSWLVQAGDTDPPPQLAMAVSATWSALSLAGRVNAAAPPSIADIVDAGPLTSLVAGLPADSPKTDFAACLGASANGSRLALGELDLSDLSQDAWFEPGAASLSPIAQRELPRLTARLRNLNPETSVVRLTAHGEGAKPRTLGQERAAALVEALRRTGLNLELEARGAKTAQGPVQGFRITLE